ncbi:MAG: hypothetical protein JSS61_07525 [Verrucomicrobia bacterium]|nr:hypothetical protein [Verrucomicrobiota bacterium]
MQTNAATGMTVLFSFGGITYEAKPYLTNPDGSKTYISNLPAPDAEKVRTYTRALLGAHEKQHAPAEAPKHLGAAGLTLLNDSILSHDFEVDPTNPIYKTGLKAIDIWNSLEAAARTAPPIAPTVPAPKPLAPSAPADLDLKDFDFTDPNWYDNLPLIQKTRALDEIYNQRAILGGVHERIYNYLKEKHRENLMSFLGTELPQLKKQCQETSTSQIPQNLRNKATDLIDRFYTIHLQELSDGIAYFIDEKFEKKEELLRFFQEQAERDGATFDLNDQVALKKFYNAHRLSFIYALSRWIDNI